MSNDPETAESAKIKLLLEYIADLEKGLDSSINLNKAQAATAKTLTDEEIIEVHVNTPFIDGYLNKNLIAFARAILKRAGEK